MSPRTTNRPRPPSNMEGPDMAPPYPQRSDRPGKAVAILVRPKPRLREPDGRADDDDEPDRREHTDHLPRRIELEPPHAELRRPWVRVVVVVKTLASRHPGQEPRVI